MIVTSRRFVLLLAAALLPSLTAGATVAHKDALAEFVAAGKSLIAVLDEVKDVKTAKAAQSNLQAAVVRFNAAKASLKQLKFDQTNPEHQAAVKTATQDMITISSQLNDDLKRIRRLPQVQNLLASTLAQLS